MNSSCRLIHPMLCIYAPAILLLDGIPPLHSSNRALRLGNVSGFKNPARGNAGASSKAMLAKVSAVFAANLKASLTS